MSLKRNTACSVQFCAVYILLISFVPMFLKNQVKINCLFKQFKGPITSCQRPPSPLFFLPSQQTFFLFNSSTPSPCGRSFVLNLIQLKLFSLSSEPSIRHAALKETVSQDEVYICRLRLILKRQSHKIKYNMRLQIVLRETVSHDQV